MLIITTASNFEEAKKIAKYLIKNHYAACVNIIPSITSIYFWNNALQEDSECMLFIKTAREFEEIKEIIKKIHSYELPEIIKIEIEGEKEYIDWIKKFSK